jgi:uncharacterized protein involved in exopolysaccharide biosynthesis
MLAKHNNSVATEETLRFTLRDLAAPILRRKRMMSLTFLFAFSVTLLLAHTQFQQRSGDTVANVTITPNPALTIAIAIVSGLLIALSLTYLVDYRDPCFHTPAQVMRTLRVPLVVAIPKRTP